MQALSRWWKNFETKHTTVAQFIVFFVLSNGITVLQLILMPASRQCSRTQPRRHGLQFLPVGVSNGHTVFLFDYPAGRCRSAEAAASRISSPWRSPC